MSPQIEAALIAAFVSLISLGGTVLVSYLGFRTTRNVTERTVRAAQNDTSVTLAAQREGSYSASVGGLM